MRSMAKRCRAQHREKEAMRDHPMKQADKPIEGLFRIVAETPPLARTYSGVSVKSAPSRIERKEGSALRYSEVLDRGDDFPLDSKGRIL